MKVNTDGVLLPAWVSLPKILSCENVGETSKIEHLDELEQLRVLDIGSGTGVISLIMAQRLCESNVQDNFRITAIDIDYKSYIESQFNFENSSWKGQLEVFHTSLQDYSIEQRVAVDSNSSCKAGFDGGKFDGFAKGKFDLILSNPPFFTNSLNAPSQARNNARHSKSLPLNILLDTSASLLKDRGVLAVILPVVEGEALLEMALSGSQFVINRLCKVKTLLNKPAKRYMIELKRTQSFVSKQGISDDEHAVIDKQNVVPKEEMPVMQEEILVMQEEGGEFYTEQYNQLVKSFYLKDLKIKSI